MKIKLITKNKIAKTSPDHLNPAGTLGDNSINKRFNRKIYNLYKNKFNLKVLDLGCSGGGFVRNCIDDGVLAIGLEGSDLSKNLGRAEWKIIPQFLFTGDITKNFQLLLNNKKMDFDLITSWEVLEHLKEDEIKGLIKNIKKHLGKNGIFIASISNLSSMSNGVELHQTRKSKEWWKSQFKKEGFNEVKELYNYFNGQYIRGRKEK